MKHLLLLGAGFSRNWGGLLANEVFDDLLGRPGIATNEYLRTTMWRHRDKGGFEGALDDLQAAYKQNPATHRENLRQFQDAVIGVFDAMNRAFFQLPEFEFQNNVATMVRTFLVRFDAIFTLNQDVLLEHHYFRHIELTGIRRWDGAQLPGMRPIAPQAAGAGPDPSWGKLLWTPAGENRIEDQLQPTLKLHGSSNWRDSDDNTMLVIGGNKSADIGANGVLARYFTTFREMLSEGDTRLFIIGYGFRDKHVNDAIVDAAIHCGLKFFVVDPYGSGIARRVNPSSGGTIYAKGPLDEAFERGLIGASTRTLSETFGRDRISHEAVMRFFV